MTDVLEEETEDLVDEEVAEDFDSLMNRKVVGEMRPNEIEEWADQLLRADANREMCRRCKDEGVETPYGEETGRVYPMAQFTKEGDPVLDDDGAQLIVDYPEIICDQGHRWYKGEGVRRDIRGPNPILFESHLHNRRRREIYTTEGVPDPSIKQGLYNRCVDAQTQALTERGWRFYDQIEDGDLIWSYLPETDSFDWQEVQEVYTQTYTGPLHVLESENISARVTDGHRWIGVHERDKSNLIELQSWFDYNQENALKNRHYIPLPHGREVVGSSPLFKLLGWVLTDGTYKNGRTDCVVYQAMHNPKIPSLMNCLRANGISTEPSMVDENNIGRWRIPSEVGKQLRAIAGQKRIEAVSLTDYEVEEYSSLLDGIIAGDGYVRELGSGYVAREIYSTKEREADAIQALATRLNIPSRLRRIENDEAFCPLEFAINLKQSQWAYIRPAAQEPEEYEGVVWCPVVESTYWVARRNGKPYVTGNTHPQGRKVNSPEQRKRHGASFFR